VKPKPSYAQVAVHAPKQPNSASEVKDASSSTGLSPPGGVAEQKTVLARDTDTHTNTNTNINHHIPTPPLSQPSVIEIEREFDSDENVYMGDDSAYADEPEQVQDESDEPDRQHYFKLKSWRHPTAVLVRPRDMNMPFAWSNARSLVKMKPDAQRASLFEGIRKRLKRQPVELHIVNAHISPQLQVRHEYDCIVL